VGSPVHQFFGWSQHRDHVIEKKAHFESKDASESALAFCRSSVLDGGLLVNGTHDQDADNGRPARV
jgi:hypothetical protein